MVKKSVIKLKVKPPQPKNSNYRQAQDNKWNPTKELQAERTIREKMEGKLKSKEEITS